MKNTTESKLPSLSVAKDLIRPVVVCLRTQSSTSLCLFLLLLLRPVLLLLSSSNKHFQILFNNLRGQEYCPWIQRFRAKSRENRASKLLHRGTLTTQLVGVQGHALNENLKRAAGARKKYNVKMFVFFHSRRSRPKTYYRKKPMYPNYYFNIVWIFLIK